LCFGLIGVVHSKAARAQMVLPYEVGQVLMERYVAVRDRRQPDFKTEGIALGAFQLFPSLQLNSGYDDNVLAEKTDKNGDAFVEIQPSLNVQSQWSRNSLSFRARGTFDRYFTQSTDNTEAWDIGTAGEIDIDRATRIRGGLIWQGNIESRQSASVFATTVKPVTYQTYGAGAGFTRDFVNLRSSTEITYLRMRYKNSQLDDGSFFDQGYRDNNLLRILERVSYAQSPSLAFFVQAKIDKRDYFEGSLGKPPRDSSELEILTGATFEASFPMRGEIGVGYVRRTFKNDFYHNTSKLAVNAKVEVFPTELTTVTMIANRRSEDSGTPESGVSTFTEVGVTVDHELLRTLILTAKLDYNFTDAEDVDRHDRTYMANFGSSYKLSPHLTLNANYGYVKRASHGAQRFRNFTNNRLAVGLTLKR
jgi:Uncharacterized protein conserved in bacteria